MAAAAAPFGHAPDSVGGDAMRREKETRFEHEQVASVAVVTRMISE